MRNGIYRVWLKGSVEAGAATLLVDGRFIACDRTHAYLGNYQDRNGRFKADVRVTRHTTAADGDTRPDDSMMVLEGLAADETLAVKVTFPHKPGFSMEADYVWVCEA